jgi:glycosyltransferase involved in cell wall biosynthesis
MAAMLNEGDVAHIQHQYPFFGGMAFYRNSLKPVLVRLKRPVVITIHELDLGERDSWLMRVYKPWFNSHIFGGDEIDRFIVHTDEYRQKLHRLGVPSEDIRVIPEGVPSVERPTVSMDEAKAELGLSGKRLLTIFGFVVRRKGYDVALDALEQLPSDVVLLIAGGCHPDDRTGFMEEIRRRVTTEGLADRVIVTDYLSDERIPLVMAASDIVLAPFTSIGNSGSILRAIAYGKAIVASDLPAFREINARRECLMLARVGDASDLAGKVRYLLDNEWQRKTLSAGAETYAAKYAVARAADETFEVYKELLV